MKLHLIDGHFSPQDALEIMTKMTEIKVRYHEHQIQTSDSEEDVKARENRIKTLQRNLQEARQYVAKEGQRKVSLQADLVLTTD